MGKKIYDLSELKYQDLPAFCEFNQDHGLILRRIFFAVTGNSFD